MHRVESRFYCARFYQSAIYLFYVCVNWLGKWWIDVISVWSFFIGTDWSHHYWFVYCHLCLIRDCFLPVLPNNCLNLAWMIWKGLDGCSIVSWPGGMLGRRDTSCLTFLKILSEIIGFGQARRIWNWLPLRNYFFKIVVG